MKENDYIEKKVNISNGDNRIANKYDVFPHQKAAHEALDKALLKYEQSGEFSGLLVIPTGGGKTFTAVEWLLKNWLNHKRKILWIAHRHALLDQAKETFEKNCYTNLVDKRTNLNFLTISGSPDHHKIKHISTDDDVVIITNLSLTQKKLKTFYDKWLEKEELCVVIDEAHHTTAKTYQQILNFVKAEVKKYFILGLTATPIRTNENEEKELMKIYKDGFIYEIGLKNLVISGILSKPYFINVDTGWQIGNEFSEKEITELNKKGESAAGLLNKIEENQERNELIVKHYIENTDKYGQLLVFAANIEHARLLSALFNKYFEEKLINNIKADYIVSNEKGEENLTLKQTNKDKLENFRRGKTQILVNVQILTEGTDLPNVQSVFITRPIKSKTLLTQMVGRALRGSKVGGTEVANIILFIDNWEDKVLWETPETIGLQEKSPYETFFKKIPSKKQPTWFVPINAINELNKIVAAYYYEQKIDLKWLDFIERIPIGIYACSEIDDELGNQDTILVFSHLEHIYARFIQDLDYIVNLEEKIRHSRWHGISHEFLFDFSLDILSEKVEANYFNHGKVYFGYSQKDVRNVLKRFIKTREKPQFISFETRKKYDLDKLIIENGIKQRFSGETINNFIDQKWHEEGHIWKAFFGYNKDFFSKEIFHILEKNTIKISTKVNNLKDILGCDQSIGKYQHRLGELDFLDLPESLYERGVHYDKLGQISKAVELFNIYLHPLNSLYSSSLFKRFPEQVLYQRGVSYYENGQTDEARLYLNAYLLQPIKNEAINAKYLLAKCLFKNYASNLKKDIFSNIELFNRIDELELKFNEFEKTDIFPLTDGNKIDLIHFKELLFDIKKSAQKHTMCYLINNKINNYLIVMKIRERLNEEEMTKYLIFEQSFDIIFKSSVEDDLRQLLKDDLGQLGVPQRLNWKRVLHKLMKSIYLKNMQSVYYQNKEIFHVNYIYDFLIEKREANTFVIYAVFKI